MTSDLVAETLQRLKTATSAAQQYVLAINLERYGTPGEFVEVRAHRDLPASGAFRDRFDSMSSLIFSENAEPTACTRERLHDNVVFYRQNEPASQIVICFSGQVGMLFAPTALQLQYLMPGADVLVLSAADAGSYSIDGYADTFRSLIDRIEKDFSLSRYRTIRTLGTSRGGFPAIAAGILLDAASMISFGGYLSDGAAEKAPENRIDTILRRGMIFRQKLEGRIFAVYAQGHRYDAEQARKLAVMTPARLIPVEGTGDHNVLLQLHVNGLLRDIYRRARFSV